MQSKYAKCVICNDSTGNSYKVASLFGWNILFAKDKPDISLYSFICIICSNTGDEELQEEMEFFLLSLKITKKSYVICELGNYFGYEKDCFGCKEIIRKLLGNLLWEELDNISIDSFPELDTDEAKMWVNKVYEIVEKNINL